MLLQIRCSCMSTTSRRSMVEGYARDEGDRWQQCSESVIEALLLALNPRAYLLAT
jgi:hypothetical protein